MSLDENQKRFVAEYTQSHSLEGSAIKAGYPKDKALQIAIDLLSTDEIANAMQIEDAKLQKVVQATKMTKEKLIQAMYFQYEKANRLGRTKEAIDVLEKIARWQGVEPDKIKDEPVKFVINNLDKDKI
jgi:phage terminase small subunit